MKKKLYRTLWFIVISVVSANAQVRIGSTNDPHPGAILDLNVDDTNSGALGLLLPRVTLNNTKDWQLAGKNPVAGMVVYNIHSVMDEGVYVWMGGAGGWFALVTVGNTTPSNPNAATINMMVLYTTEAKAWADQNGNKIDSLINLALDQANTVMRNSQADVIFKLVHQQEIAYKESASSPNIDLIRLKNPGDGFADEAHTLRTRYNADLVMLLIDDVNSGVSGAGYILNDESGDPKDSFSVVKIKTILNK